MLILCHNFATLYVVQQNTTTHVMCTEIIYVVSQLCLNLFTLLLGMTVMGKT